MNNFSCEDGNNTVELTVTFMQPLDPREQTAAILLLAMLPIQNDGLFWWKDSGIPKYQFPINNGTNPCIVYNSYNYCLNSGRCEAELRVPKCVCPTYTNSTFSGEYCEAEIAMTTTPVNKSNNESILVLAIVLPMIAFIILAFLLFLAIYYCYKR